MDDVDSVVDKIKLAFQSQTEQKLMEEQIARMRQLLSEMPVYWGPLYDPPAGATEEESKFLTDIQCSSVETIKQQLDAGIDVHMYNDKALRTSVYQANVSTVELLLRYGATIPPDLVEYLFSDKYVHNRKIITLLVKYGLEAKRSAYDQLRSLVTGVRHDTVLAQLWEKGDHETVHALLQCGWWHPDLTTSPEFKDLFRREVWTGGENEFLNSWLRKCKIVD